MFVISKELYYSYMYLIYSPFEGYLTPPPTTHSHTKAVL
uniref:Uncharacterized protein n=1 Tax=Anguilla anguilla TaxID=7936 RepID=A0A0E9RXV8_ANGAN